MDVGPARQPRSPLVFRVGAEPHVPRLERFPTTTDFLKTEDASRLVNMLIAAIWELKIHDDSVGWNSVAGRGSVCSGC